MTNLSKEEFKTLATKASRKIYADVYISIAIQFSIVFVTTMLITTFFSNEGELLSLVNKNLDRFTGNSSRYFILTLFAILGAVSFFILVFHQVKLIDNLDKAMTSIPRRICEEFMKYLITMTSSVTGIGASIMIFLYLNPKHSDFAKMNEFAFLTVYIFILGSFISCFFGVITQHREIESTLADQTKLAKNT
jgi:hypothetical protein